MRNALVLAFAAGALSACGSPRQADTAKQPTPPVVAPPAPHASTDPQLLRALGLLATGREPTPQAIAAAKASLDGGSLTLGQHIDSLLATNDFAMRVAPLIILRERLSLNAAGAPANYTLNHTDGDDPIYYLDDKPCDRKHAVRVKPWWDPEHDIAVCDDSYKPTQWMAKPKASAHTEMACLSQAAPSLQADGVGVRCGCGPNLIRCFKSRDQRLAVIDSLRAELRQTVAHHIEKGHPVEKIFTANETWRDPQAEFVRLEQSFENKQVTDTEPAIRALASWPAGGTFAPREEVVPGAHAGILTSPLIVYSMSDLRQRMSVIYDVLWCIQPDSAGASPEQAIQISDPNLQLSSSGWKQLAAKPVCTNCHARLDYGMQFFTGWPNAYERSFYSPLHQQKGTGALYGANIEDARGNAALTPQGFAQLAVAQPEFRRCMARDVGAYVFGDRLTSARMSALEKVADAPGGVQLRQLMRTSMEALAAEWSTTAAAKAPIVGVASADATLTVTKPQHEQLDKWCFACHEDSAPVADFSPATLPRTTMVEMLSNVASGRMPKDDPLDDNDRRDFIETFIPTLWSGADAVAARAYFVERMAALPAYRPEIIIDTTEARVGGRGTPWRLLEQTGRPDRAQLTPGLVTIYGVATLEACRAAHTAPADVERCLEQNVLPLDLTIAPH
jgi:hypothetical protein